MYSGYITFNLSLSCLPGNRLEFFINDFLWNSFECSGCNGPFEQRTFPVNGTRSSSMMYFKWIYVQDQSGNLTAECDRAVISTITVAGIADGLAGSTSCVSCQPGFYSDNSLNEICSPCPPGLTRLVAYIH
jgi:hypothetical protein